MPRQKLFILGLVLSLYVWQVLRLILKEAGVDCAGCPQWHSSRGSETWMDTFKALSLNYPWNPCFKPSVQTIVSYW